MERDDKRLRVELSDMLSSDASSSEGRGAANATPPSLRLLSTGEECVTPTETAARGSTNSEPRRDGGIRGVSSAVPATDAGASPATGGTNGAPAAPAPSPACTPPCDSSDGAAPPAESGRSAWAIGGVPTAGGGRSTDSEVDTRALLAEPC